MPLTTSYPTTKQTFAEQTDLTIPFAPYPNTQSATVMALEDRVGGDYSIIGDPDHEGRLLSLEASGAPKRTFDTVAPADLALQEWFDTTDDDHWAYKIQHPDNTWQTVAADAISIYGRAISNTTPANGDTLVWDATASLVKWQAGGGLSNPLTTIGDIMVGVAPVVSGKATLGRLGIGLNGQALGVSGGALTWINSMSNPMTQVNSLVVGGTVTSGVAAPTELGPGTIGQILTMLTGTSIGWKSPIWVTSPSSAVQGSVLYFGADSTWHQLTPGTAGQYLRTAGLGADPAWTNLPSSSPGSAMVVPTGSNTGDLLMYTSPDWGNLSPGASGTWLRSNGAGVAPSWGTPPVGLTNPMGTTGAIIYSSDGAGTPTSLVIGSSGQVLTVSGGVPAWVAIPNQFSFITTAGDLVVGTGSGTVTRLAKGATNGFVLTMVAGAVAWAAATGGFANPMTTLDDIITGGAAGVATRLAKGTDSQVLTIDPTTHHIVWANSASGFSDPMSTIGDIIIRNGSNATARLGIGSSAQFLGVTSGIPAWKSLPLFNGTIDGLVVAGTSNTTQYLRADGAWATPPGTGGFSNPMTTLDDIIIGAAAGAAARLAKGSNGDVLTISSSGHVVWQASSGGTATGVSGANPSIINTTPTPDITVLVNDGFGASYYDAIDNGHTFRFNGSNAFNVSANGVYVLDRANTIFSAYSQFRINRNSGMTLIGPSSGSDPEVNLHASGFSTSANTLNPIVLVHNPTNTDETIAGINFKVAGPYSAYNKGSFYFQRHAVNDGNFGLGRFGIALATDPTSGNNLTFADTMFSFMEQGAFGVLTTAPPRGIAVGEGLNIGVQATTQHAVTALAAGTAVAGSGGSLAQNGDYVYYVVGLTAAGEETAPSAKVIKQLANSSGNTWRIPLSWTAPSGVTVVGYRVYFYDHNSATLARHLWQYLDTGSTSTSYNHDNPVGTAVKWAPVGGAEMKAKLSGDVPSWVGENFGTGGLKDFGSGTGGVIAVANATAVPSANPTGGALLYADTGALKARGSSGTVTTVAAAEPHCPECGRDFVFEATNPKYGHLIVCMWCLTDGMTKGVIRRSVDVEG